MSGEKCLVCGITQSIEMHHVFPLEYGGARNGTMAPLCGTHHTLVHKLGEEFHAGSVSGQQLMVESSKHKNPEALYHLANQIRRAKVMYHKAQSAAQLQERDIDLRPDARRKFQTSLTKEEHEMLVALKNRMGLSSQEAVFKTLLKTAYRRLVPK